MPSTDDHPGALDELPNDDLVLHCCACGYDVSASPSQVCSECGWAATPDDAYVTARRLEFLKCSSRIPWTGSIWLLYLSLAVGVGAWFKGESIYAVLVLFIPLMTLLYGMIATQWAAGHRRVLTYRLWITTCGWLHLPVHAGWALGLILWPVLQTTAPNQTGNVWFMAAIGLVAVLLITAWAFLSGASFIHWVNTWQSLADDSWWNSNKPQYRSFRRGVGIVFSLNLVVGMLVYWYVLAQIIFG